MQVSDTLVSQNQHHIEEGGGRRCGRRQVLVTSEAMESDYLSKNGICYDDQRVPTRIQAMIA
jgi:hypothetical protein